MAEEPNDATPFLPERSSLKGLREAAAGCRGCHLWRNATQTVFGDGRAGSRVMFVGEMAGDREDREGRPFVGQAGGLLNELLKAIGWRREEVFITNVVKCRPPGNRDPEPAEIAACAPYLKRQLAVLDPAVVVTLGRHSLGTFMPGARITGTHGTERPVDPATGARDATAYAMYHPAAALRQYSLRQTMLEDMCGLPDTLTRARDRRTGNAEPAVVVAAPAAVAVAIEPETENAASLPRENEPETLATPSPVAADEPQLGFFG